MELILPILIAAVVGLLIFGLFQLITSSGRGEKKKLAQRLTTDRPYDGPQSSMGGGNGQGNRPLLMQGETEGMPPALVRIAFLRKINRQLIQAFPQMRVVKFLSIAAGCAFGAFLLAFLLSGGALLIPIAAGVAAGYLPFFVLTGRRSKRQRILADQLPEALEFLARILQAGHSFSTGLQMMGDELPKPLSGEFRRAYDQHSLGQSVEEALKDMTTRIESSDFAFFITAVLIQRQTGGDLSEVLKNISGMIRARMRLQNQVKAKTAEGRFTGYIMVAFPMIMFLIAYTLNPEYAEVLVNTSTGRWLLGFAGGLQILGLFAIKKITTVKV